MDQEKVKNNKDNLLADSHLDLGIIFGRSIFNPVSLFSILSRSDRSVFFGWIFCLGFSFLYSITALLLYLRGWQPSTQPFIAIPIEKYYLYQTFFTIPVTIIALGLGTTLAFWFSHILGSEAPFKKYWGPVCVASVIPSFFMTWIPETFFKPFLEPQQPIEPPYDLVRIIAGSFWIICLVIIAIKQTSGLNWLKSFSIGLIASMAIGSTMSYFYR